MHRQPYVENTSHDLFIYIGGMYTSQWTLEVILSAHLGLPDFTVGLL